MENCLILVVVVASLFSCKKESNLVEVQIPDPEVASSQTTFGNPADVKVDEGGVFQMKGLKYLLQDLDKASSFLMRKIPK